MCCVVLRECCVMCYVVCSSVSLLSYVCSISVGDGEGEEKSSGEIRGQRPHGATPLPTPCGAGALEVFLDVIVWSIHNACEILIAIVWFI